MNKTDEPAVLDMTRGLMDLMERYVDVPVHELQSLPSQCLAADIQARTNSIRLALGMPYLPVPVATYDLPTVPDLYLPGTGNIFDPLLHQKAILVRPRGISGYVFSKGHKWNFGEFQKWVDGFVQPFTLNDGKVLLLDEDGKPKNLPYNPTATLIAFGQAFPQHVFESLSKDGHPNPAGTYSGDFIVGTALIIEKKMLEES